jgi:hypothetical protein
MAATVAIPACDPGSTRGWTPRLMVDFPHTSVVFASHDDSGGWRGVASLTSRGVSRLGTRPIGRARRTSSDSWEGGAHGPHIW